MSIDRFQLSRKIRDIILSNRGVPASLYQRSLHLIKLQESLRHEIGTPLGEHLYLANFSQDTIIIITDSPAWATKLRFKIPGILEIAKNITGQTSLKTVRIRIDPGLICDNSNEKPVAISPATSELLRKVAENINDTELQRSLVRLSQNNSK
jgi:hypothetical protein